jgi:hypothetical protein
LPSWTVTPATRRAAAAASPSGVRPISSAVIADTTPSAVRCSLSAAATLPRSSAAVTTIPSSASAVGSSEMLSSTVPSGGTITPVIVLVANPIITVRTSTEPAGARAMM